MNKVNTKYQILLPYLIKYFPSFSIGLVFLLLTNAIGLYIPSQLEKAVDLISQSKDSVISPIEGVLLNILLAAIILALVRTLSRLFIFYAARNIEYDLRRDLFSHLLEVDMKFHHQKGVGDMMSRFTNDLGQVRLLLGPGLLNMINSGVVFLGALSLMFWQSPRLLAYSLLPYLPAIILIRWVSLQLYRRNLAVVTFLGKMNDFLQQVLTSLFVVHSYVREPNFYRQFNQLSFELFHKNMGMLDIYRFPLV